MFQIARNMRSSVAQAPLAAVLLVFCGLSHATVQKADEIKIGHSSFTIAYSPLLYRYGHTRKDWRRVVNEIGGSTSCTANNVGFVAHWEVTDGALYLVSLVLSPCSNHEPSDLAQWFEVEPDGRVKAKWFTGQLVAYKEWALGKDHTYVQSYPVDQQGKAEISFKNGILQTFPQSAP